MTEIADRLKAAWYSLCGWGVIRGVSILYGEVEVKRGRTLVSGDSEIRSCMVLVPGRLRVTGKGRFEGNEGNALGPWTGRPYAGEKTP